jgi:hypothetical protein
MEIDILEGQPEGFRSAQTRSAARTSGNDSDKPALREFEVSETSDVISLRDTDEM